MSLLNQIWECKDCYKMVDEMFEADSYIIFSESELIELMNYFAQQTPRFLCIWISKDESFSVAIGGDFAGISYIDQKRSVYAYVKADPPVCSENIIFYSEEHPDVLTPRSLLPCKTVIDLITHTYTEGELPRWANWQPKYLGA